MSMLNVLAPEKGPRNFCSKGAVHPRVILGTAHRGQLLKGKKKQCYGIKILIIVIFVFNLFAVFKKTFLFIKANVF
jgi:hypothetical protein